MNSLAESVDSRRGATGDAAPGAGREGGDGVESRGRAGEDGGGPDEGGMGRVGLRPLDDEGQESFAEGDDCPGAGTLSLDNGAAADDFAAGGSGGKGTKRYALAFALLISFSTVLAAVYLSGSKLPDSNVLTPTKLPIEEQAKLEGIHSYGYSHTMHTKNTPGWLSWPADADYEYGTDFLLYGDEDGVASPVDCAAKCSESGALAGSWSVSYVTCWCSHAEVRSLCKEPCVDGYTVDFAKASLHKLDYCGRSVCDEGWYHSSSYCDLDVKFDKEECDAKIATLLASDAGDGGPQPTSSPSAGGMSEQLATYEKENAPLPTASPTVHSTVLFIKSSALQTAWKSHPDDKDGGKEDLSVQNDDRVSYIRFDVPSVLGTDATLKKATLNLHLVTQSNHKESSTIIVDAMPNGGMWQHGAISWKEPLNSEGLFNVNSFSVVPLESEDGGKRLYEVDVTSGISEGEDSVTFRLTTESDRRWYFASKGCCGGTAAPELLLTVSPPEPGSEVVADKPTMGPVVPGSAAAPTLAQTDHSPGSFHIESSAAQTTMKSHPDATWGGEMELGVEKGNQISYLSFHLSPHMGRDDVVTSASLNLYSIASSDRDDSPITVVVDVLPNSDDWTHGSISWNSAPNPESGWIRVNTLPEVSPLTGMMNTVDVTSAVSAGDEWVTFRLFTESDGKLYFASADWNEHEQRPSLVVFLAHSEPVPTTANSPAVSADTQASDSSRVFIIEPSAAQTTMSTHPDSTWGGMDQLTVKKDDRVSYLRFNLSSLGGGAIVTNATLNLWAINMGGGEDAITVFVDSLQNVDDWTQGSISWNDPPDYEESTSTNTFSVSPAASMMYEVDVTSAINPEDEWITFVLSTKSDTKLYFASTEWNDSQDKPALEVYVAYPEPTVNPTASPVPPTASPVPPTASPVPPTASPVTPTASPVTESSELKYTSVPMQSPSTTEAEASARHVVIQPSALQTTMKGHPDADWGGKELLAVKKDNSISYIRFDLSPISGENVEVTRAILYLYLVKSSEHLSTVFVDVDVLPDGGGWLHGSISWNNPPETDGWSNMGTFAAVPLTETNDMKQLHEVDVTSAISPYDEWITFRLSTQSAGELRIASEDWEEGEAVPELHVLLQ